MIDPGLEDCSVQGETPMWASAPQSSGSVEDTV